MIAVTVLSVLAAGFAYSMKVETKLARNSDSDAELLWLGTFRRRTGALDSGTAVERRAREPYDSLNQVWAGGTGGARHVEQSPGGYLPGRLRAGRREVLAEDHRSGTEGEHQYGGRGDAAAGARASWAWMRAMRRRSWVRYWTGSIPTTTRTSAERRAIIIRDWTPPYFAKNAPIDDLSELLLVKGVTLEDRIWGGVSTNHSRAAFQDRVGRIGANADMPAYSVGLVNLFTPISTGRININTASSEVLQMVPMIDENVAAGIISFRERGEGTWIAVTDWKPGQIHRGCPAQCGCEPPGHRADQRDTSTCGAKPSRCRWMRRFGNIHAPVHGGPCANQPARHSGFEFQSGPAAQSEVDCVLRRAPGLRQAPFPDSADGPWKKGEEK